MSRYCSERLDRLSIGIESAAGILERAKSPARCLREHVVICGQQTFWRGAAHVALESLGASGWQTEKGECFCHVVSKARESGSHGSHGIACLSRQVNNNAQSR